MVSLMSTQTNNAIVHFISHSGTETSSAFCFINISGKISFDEHKVVAAEIQYENPFQAGFLYSVVSSEVLWEVANNISFKLGV